ncbi:MAG: PD-(D/E)XK nuclease family protein [Geodermatophilaceae bacterium]|nr:PD-(D/E)XK nuclease family protein [Geodermatophilaceae bacterium]
MSEAQQILPGSPTPLFSATPSKLAAFDACPRRFRMTYLDRPSLPKGSPWAHNSMGAAVHAALRSWWDLPVARRTPSEGVGLLRRLWSDQGFRDHEQSLDWLATASQWVRSYLEAEDAQCEPVGLERHVAAKTDRLALSGRIDRIDERDGDMVVVDYKTGRSGVSDAAARGSPALAIYVLGVRRTLRRNCTRVELHHLPSGDVAAFEHTDQSLARHVDRAEDIAADIGRATTQVAAGMAPDEAFQARTGAGCGWCDLRRHCPDGQRAAPAREPWSFLAPMPDLIVDRA